MSTPTNENDNHNHQESSKFSNSVPRGNGMAKAVGSRTSTVLEKLGLEILIPIGRSFWGSLISIIPPLLTFIAFTFVLSIWTLHLFKGKLTNKCILEPDVNLTKDELEKHNHNSDNWFVGRDGGFEICGSNKECPHGYKCFEGYGPNPYYGFESFDSIFWSYLAVLVISLNDFWEQTCQKILRVKGSFYISVFVTIIVTSYCVYYLILAAVFSAFNKIWQEENDKDKPGEKPNSKDDIPFIDEEERAGRDRAKSNTDDEAVPAVAVISNGVKHQTPPNKISSIACHWDCCNCCSKLREICGRIVFDPFVQQIIVLCLLFDVANMACDHDRMDYVFYQGLTYYWISMGLVYILEFLLKLIALSPCGYFKVGWNVLEFFIVLGFIIDWMLESVHGLSILRMLFILKLFRIGRFWPTYNNALRLMCRVFKVQLVFLTILGIFSLIMAAIGTHVFGEGYQNNDIWTDGFTRWHLMDMGHSFLMVFRSICGEWVEGMYDAIVFNGFSCIPYFFVIVLFGDILMLNLFTVFQVAYITVEQKDEAKHDKNSLIDAMSDSADRFVRFWKLVTSKLCGRSLSYYKLAKEKANQNRVSDANASSIQINQDDNAVVDFENSRTPLPGLNQPASQTEDCCPTICFLCCSRDCGEWSWWINLRRKCFYLINSIFFELFVISVIIVTCALWTSRYEEFDKASVTHDVMDQMLRIVLPLIFLVETVIRLMGHGVKGYFQNGFRCWEFFFILAYLFGAFANLMGLGSTNVEILIACRIFRLLGLTFRFEVSRTIMNTLVESFPGMVNVFIQGLFVWLIFGIMGVQMFAGKYYRCVDDEGNRVNTTIVPDRRACVMNNLTWVNPDIHFDNILDSYLSLSQIATFKGWITIIHNAMDSRLVDDQPSEEINFSVYPFFIFFVVFGSYFTYILWFSVLIDGFNRQKQLSDKEMGINSPEDELYHKSIQIMSSRNPNPAVVVPQGKLSHTLKSVVDSLPFDVLVLILVILYVILLSFDHFGESRKFLEGMNYIRLVFVLVFVIELVMRALIEGFSFVKNPINLIDVMAIILELIGDIIIVNEVHDYVFPPMILRLGRVFQIIGKYKWMKRFPAFRRVFSAIRKIIPYLAFLVFFESLVIFVYAFWGLLLWREVKQFGSHIFFNTLGESILILCQMFTSSGWDGFLSPIMNERDCKDNDDGNNCGNKNLAVVYVVSFVTISVMIFFTLLTVVTIQMFSEAGVEELERLENEQMDHFYKTWSQYDKGGLGYVDLNQLASLLDLQSSAFGFNKTGDNSLAPLDIPIVEGERVHHRDVLDALFRWSLREKGIEIKNVESFDQLSHPESDYKPISSTLWRKREENSAAKIRKAWGQYKDQKL